MRGLFASERVRLARSKASWHWKLYGEAPMAMVLQPASRGFLFSLKRADVRFVVIGAYALATLGRPRYTDDLDVFVEASRTNAERLARALREHGGFEELARAVPDHMATADRMFSLGRPPLAIDVTTGIDGVPFEEAWEGRREIVSEGTPIPFLGRVGAS